MEVVLEDFTIRLRDKKAHVALKITDHTKAASMKC